MASFEHEDWHPQYAEKDDKDKVRLIGVEFEGAIKKREQIPEELQFVTEEYMNENNIGESECYDEDEDEWYYEGPSRADYVYDELEKLGYEIGGVGYDGGGKEIVTLPDSYTFTEQGGSERFKKVVNLMETISKADASSGTHIHVSKLDSDVKTTWQNLYWFCMVFGPQLQKIFGRITHWARTPLPRDHFVSNNDSRIKIFEAPKTQPEPIGVYGKGSIVVDRNNRYEFRGAKASHDLEEINAWIELCHNIVEVCARGYIQNIPFADVIRTKQIRAYVNKIGKNNPERKITPAERAMRISEVGYVQISERDKLL